jgi:outer membrane immunogenic protein
MGMLRTSFLVAAAAALVSGAASAADLPIRAAPPAFVAAPPVFTWTGFYAGTVTGYAFSDRQTILTSGNNTGAGGLTDTILNVAQGRRPAAIGINHSDLTSIGGGIGYDHQFTPGPVS